MKPELQSMSTCIATKQLTLIFYKIYNSQEAENQISYKDFQDFNFSQRDIHLTSAKIVCFAAFYIFHLWNGKMKVTYHIGPAWEQNTLAQQKLLENTTHRVITVIKSWGLFIIENYVVADLQRGFVFFSLIFFS